MCEYYCVMHDYYILYIEPECNIRFCVSCSEPGKCETCQAGYELEKDVCVVAPTPKGSSAPTPKGSSGDDNGSIIGMI